MTDEEYLGTDDFVLFLEETVRRKECGEPHAFDNIPPRIVDRSDGCPF